MLFLDDEIKIERLIIETALTNGIFTPKNLIFMYDNIEKKSQSYHSRYFSEKFSRTRPR